MIDKNFHSCLKRTTVFELADVCGFPIVGNNEDFMISDVAVLNKASKTELSFFGNRKYFDDFRKTSAGAVIITEKDVEHLPEGAIGLIFPNVLVGFAGALDVLYEKATHPHHISATARIHETAKIGDGCYVGENVFIGANVEIGDNVFIGHNSVIESGCKIGSGCIIRHSVSIAYSIIGNNVTIHSGARIGECGFGIIPMISGTMYVQQLGRVIIGDDVRIGANTTIDRGSIEDTVISNGAIIDNLVQLGHNVAVGERSILVAQVGVAGSTKIGRGVVLAGQVGVAGHLEVGDGVVAAAKSGIASNVEAGKTVGGIPAVDVSIWKRQTVFLKNAVTKKTKPK